jgi:FkbM family methyltransferase
MTSLMAARVGRQGKVYAFEPHPKIFEELSGNEKLWRDLGDLGRVHLQNIALSNRSGVGVLGEPDHFETNRGIAFLIDNNSGNEHPDDTNGSRIWSVELNKLDELITDKEKIKVIKLDVEGHELKVLEGATELISTYVRDIIFEDHGIYPTLVTQLLENYGYTILKIDKGVLRPHLQPPIFKSNLPSFEPPSYLATKDVTRAICRIRKIGWKSLSSSRSV